MGRAMASPSFQPRNPEWDGPLFEAGAGPAINVALKIDAPSG